jgi:hypothetical protein
MSLLLSNFYPKANAVLTTGNQNITGIKTFSERIVAPEIRGSGLGGANRKIDLQLGQLFAGTTSVSVDYWNRGLSGNWRFNNRPNVNGTGILLDGEGGGGSTIFDGNREIRRETWPAYEELGGDNVVEFLENVFFPYIPTSVSIYNFNIRTYGVDSVSSIGFSGIINRQDDQVTGIAYRNGSTILNGPNARADTSAIYNTLPQLISLNTTLTATSNQVYNTRLYVVNPQGQSQTRDSLLTRIRFEPIYYYGVSASSDLVMGTTYNNTVFALFSSSNPSNYTYNVGSRPTSVTHSISPNNQYIYFIYPSPASTQDNIANWGNSLSSIFDLNTNFEYISSYQNLGTINISFPNGKVLRYRVYRSNNLLTLAPGQNFNLRFTFGA